MLDDDSYQKVSNYILTYKNLYGKEYIIKRLEEIGVDRDDATRIYSELSDSLDYNKKSLTSGAYEKKNLDNAFLLKKSFLKNNLLISVILIILIFVVATGIFFLT